MIDPPNFDDLPDTTPQDSSLLARASLLGETQANLISAHTQPTAGVGDTLQVLILIVYRAELFLALLKDRFIIIAHLSLCEVIEVCRHIRL
jgi:hypothetical protein